MNSPREAIENRIATWKVALARCYCWPRSGSYHLHNPEHCLAPVTVVASPSAIRCTTKPAQVHLADLGIETTFVGDRTTWTHGAPWFAQHQTVLRRSVPNPQRRARH